jgi:LysR family cyn operon transcriptional activator
MELRHLRYFAGIAEARSISRAAGQLRITQPALSRQLRDLEDELGVRLFERMGRRIELTAEGEDLLERSRDLLAGAASLTDRAHALRSGEAGLLRVGATPQTLESVLTSFLPRYRRAHPAVEVRLVEDGGLQLLGRLERGEMHLALTLPGEGFRHCSLFPTRLLAVMPRPHRLGRRTTIEVADLADEPLLLLRRDFGSRQWFDGACQLAHVQPRIILESGAPHTLTALARAGHGIAIVSSNVVLDRKGVQPALLLQGGKSIGRWGALVWDPRRFLPSYARAFIEELLAFTRHAYPGKEFERVGPPVPRPRDPGGRAP